MNTQVATKNQNTAVSALASLKQGVKNVRQAIPASSTEPILRLGRDGVWVYGQENIEVEPKSLWAINPLSIHHGFVCWTDYKEDGKKNELLGEVYAPMMDAPISVKSLQDYGWPWKPSTTVLLKCTSGDDEGTQVIYKPSSVGGANFMQRLLDAIDKQLSKDTDAIVPVVELEHDHYPHKKWGKIYVPEFRIERWATIEVESPAEAAAETEAEAEIETEDEEQKTEGRTRRRARRAA